MSAKFYAISFQEMKTFVESLGFQQLPKEKLSGNCKEVVFAKRIDAVNESSRVPLSLRIYTGIDIRTLESREIGSDAIRVCVMAKTADDTAVGISSTKRVHRVENWKANLSKRIDEMNACQFKICTKCKRHAMITRKPKKNGKHFKPFLGCLGYPNCKHSESI